MQLSRKAATSAREADAGYLFFGQIEKGLETFDKAIRLSPRDPNLQYITMTNHGGSSR
jgi:hypothetical protein